MTPMGRLRHASNSLSNCLVARLTWVQALIPNSCDFLDLFETQNVHLGCGHHESASGAVPPETEGRKKPRGPTVLGTRTVTAGCSIFFG